MSRVRLIARGALVALAVGLGWSGSSIAAPGTPGTPAKGSIDAAPGSSLNDGETFTIADGFHNPTIFEFDLNAGGVTPTHVQVPFTVAQTEPTVETTIRNAINVANGAAILNVAASTPGNGLVELTNDSVGGFGNNLITETVAYAGFAVTGMSGGSDPTDDPPALGAIGDKTVDEGQQLRFTLSAVDPDGDPLTYSASNLPAGASFDPATRTFTWTPGFAQSGSYPSVHFSVSDGSGTDVEDIAIAVRNVNRAPLLDPIGNKTANEGQQLQFALSATDPDGDPLTYLASNLPAGARFDPAAGTFTWTPGFEQAGSYPNVYFQVFDGATIDYEEITITVNDVPSADTPDTAAPETTIDSGPKKVTKPRATFSFSSSEPSSTFECQLDKNPFGPCTSPVKLKRLRDGKHAFSVRATDAAGNADLTPATQRFKVKLP